MRAIQIYYQKWMDREYRYSEVAEHEMINQCIQDVRSLLAGLDPMV